MKRDYTAVAQSEQDPDVGLKSIVDVFKEREEDWRNGPVVYQVFVDRFAPSSNLEQKRHLYGEGCTLHQWDELPTKGSQNKALGYWQHELDFWGGDLQSLMTKMDHMSSELQIDVLYCQPIFEAYSNHKYDTTDYFKVDPQYGTDKDFQQLVENVHKRGMHLVLDGVFNHLGKSFLFRKVRHGAAPEKQDWFFLGNEYGPDGYKCWAGAPSLVELRLETTSCQDYFWRSSNSVVGSWLKRGADGWRLDVASEIGYHFCQDITDHAHKHKEGSLVVGEVWAFPSKWNKALDGTLSLHSGQVLKGVAQGVCAGYTAAVSIQKLIEDSSIEAVLKSWIVLSNHDMDRLATALPIVTERRLALALQFTVPGSPLIYYGDEFAMEGGEDPANRAPMQWDRADKDEKLTLEFVKTLTGLRRRLRALRIGDYTALPAQKLMAFMRTTDRVEDVVVVLANGSDTPVKEMVILPNADILGHTQIVDQLTGEETYIRGATLCEEVAAKSAKIYSIKNDNSPSGMQYKRIYGHYHTLASVKPFP